MSDLSNFAGLPPLALSVRQPWAWAIIHAGKDIENRTWGRTWVRGRIRIAIHAAKGMTRAELHAAASFMWQQGISLPPAMMLDRGGIIGSVELVDLVMASDSPWFEGPYGFVLRDPQPCDFTPARGAMGFFRWRPFGLAASIPLVRSANDDVSQKENSK